MRIRYALLLLLFATGCATLFKGPNTNVEVVAPPGTAVKEDSVFLRRSLTAKGFTIRLRSSEEHTLTFVRGAEKKIVTIEPTFDPSWFVVDLFGFPIGTITDGATGAIMNLDDISFPKTKDKDWGLDSVELINTSVHERGPWSLGLRLFLGYSFPFRQVPLFFTHYGGGLSYYLTDKFELHTTLEFSDLMDYGLPDSIVYGNSPMTNTMFGVRYFITKGLYVLAEGGPAHLSISSVSRYSPDNFRAGNVALPDEAQTMWMAGGGFGFTGRFAYIEIRKLFGLSPLRLYQQNGSFSAVTFNIGFVAEF